MRLFGSIPTSRTRCAANAEFHPGLVTCPISEPVSSLTIAHLYPQEMNTYGDSGNIVALQKRLQWRGYQVEVVDVHPGQAFDFHRADIVFGGGGQDSGQWRIGDDLAERGDELKSAAALTVCPC